MTDIGNCVECGKEVKFTRTGKHCNECSMEKAGAMRTMVEERISTTSMLQGILNKKEPVDFDVYAITFLPQSIYEYITHRAFIPYIWNIPEGE